MFAMDHGTLMIHGKDRWNMSLIFRKDTKIYLIYYCSQHYTSVEYVLVIIFFIFFYTHVSFIRISDKMQLASNNIESLYFNRRYFNVIIATVTKEQFSVCLIDR